MVNFTINKFSFFMTTEQTIVLHPPRHITAMTWWQARRPSYKVLQGCRMTQWSSSPAYHRSTSAGWTSSVIHVYHYFGVVLTCISLCYYFWWGWLIIVSWGPELGRYCCWKMFHWEPEGCYWCTLSLAIAPFWLSADDTIAGYTVFWLQEQQFDS